ncbi:hypothetical protein [Paludibacter jiangxiensis]|uniref:Uncharacterized protein n=1 Tax=Paludibacter jiangxiensis TaxID=681398 RepID=A0A171AHD0_9BACT|nr:hypothetical protein [Paludibacter jiangxiensis]GAT63729.1 hypothetical protein PJIAN_4270 [Paludibacter jiangxiensis]
MKTKITKWLFGLLACVMVLSMPIFKKYRYQRALKPSVADSSAARMVCDIDTNAAYHTMWEKLFLTQDLVRQEYYNNHITVVTSTPVII